VALSVRSVPAWLRTAALGVVVVGACVPAGASGQSGCQFVDPTRSAQSVTIPGQGRIWYLGGPAFRCADGVRIRADSAVVYESQNLVLLMNSVRFRDPERTLLSDQARYFTRVGRLQAEGHLVLRDTVRGSVIENGELVYLRKTEQRQEEQITVVTGVDHVRPKATLYMRPAADSVPPAADSVPPDSVPSLVRLPADSTVAVDPVGVPDSAMVADSTVARDSGVVRDSSMAVDTTVVPDTTTVPDTTVAQDTATVPLVAVADSGAVAGLDSAPPVRAVSPARPPAPRDTVQVPFEVEADNLFLQGDQYFRATGTVYIARDALYARGDSVEYDQVAGRMLIHGSAHVETASYDLLGQDINIGMVGSEMRTVRAVHRAELLGDDLELNAPVIVLFLVEGAPERLVAIPLRPDPEAAEEPDSVDLVRPVALAERFRLTADSLDVLAPGDVLQRIYATGRARGDSSARDSLNVESLPDIARTDWLEGDTVIAYFVQAPPPDPDLPADTAREEYQLERLVALGDARSLYRLLPSDSTSRPGVDAPAVHYVTGATITITLVEGEVDLMEVDGPTRGWHLEPEKRVARGDSIPPDTSGAPPDTVPPPPPDTASAAGTGRGAGTPEDPGPPHDGGSRRDDAALPAAALLERGRKRRSRR